MKIAGWNETVWQPENGEATVWWSDLGCNCPPPSQVGLHAGMEVPPMSKGTLRLGPAEPDLHAHALADMSEDEIVSALLYSPVLFTRLLAPLVNDRHDFWAAIGLRRCDLRDVPKEGKPGDIDVVLGHMRRGAPDFSRFVGVEIKVRRPKPGDIGNMSSLGTTQAKGLFDIGCDQAALVHIVAAHQSREFAYMQDNARIGALFGMEVTNVVNALAHATEPHRDAHLGYVLAAWGHPAQNSPLARSALFVYPLIRPAPNRRRFSLEWEIAHDKLRRALIDHWNQLTPRDHIIRRCYKCGQVVPVARQEQKACPACGKLWVRPFTQPLAEDVQPYNPEEP